MKNIIQLNGNLNSNLSTIVLRNPVGFKTLIFLSMFYLCFMFCNAILTNRYIGTDAFFILGGTLTSPLIFIFDDIIAEIYGYKITQHVILIGFLAQTVFAIICELILLTPYPSFFNEQSKYAYILGPSLLRIDISGFASYLTANLLNSYILTRWKILLKGKRFWLRSIGSSIFSEALYSFLAILMMEIKSIPLNDILKVCFISFSIKAIYSMVLAKPANILVDFLKKKTNIDVFDYSKKFSPSDFIKSTEESSR